MKEESNEKQEVIDREKRGQNGFSFLCMGAIKNKPSTLQTTDTLLSMVNWVRTDIHSQIFSYSIWCFIVTLVCLCLFYIITNSFVGVLFHSIDKFNHLTRIRFESIRNVTIILSDKTIILFVVVVVVAVLRLFARQTFEKNTMASFR